MTAGDTSARPGDNRGYPEKQPHDKDEARKSVPRKPADPDDGGLDRDPGKAGTNDSD